MKLLVVTRADENVTAYTRYTHPILKVFAEKWNADFKVLDSSCGPVFQRKLALYELFESYDRVLHMDSDIVINRDCPNIFDMIPSDYIGLVFEDKGSRLKNRRDRIKQVKRALGDIEHWVEGYFNMGFFVVSSIHQEMFTKIKGKLWGEDQKKKPGGADQTHLCYQIMRLKYKYVDLGYKFNHMSMFSELWNGSPSRFDSHIIHYAGQAKFPDKGGRSRPELMRDDIVRIYGQLIE